MHLLETVGVGGTCPLWCDVVEEMIHVSCCVCTMYVLTKLCSSLQPLAPLLHVPPSKNDDVLVIPDLH